MPGTSVKTETLQPAPPTTSSASRLRRKELELEAARAQLMLAQKMLEYEVAKSARKSRCPSVTQSDKEKAVNEWLKNSDQPPPSYSAPQQQQPIADDARAHCDESARTYDRPPLATETARAHVVDPARTYGRLPSAKDIVKQQPPMTKEAAQAPYVTPACTSAHLPPADSILQLAHTLKDMMTSSSTNISIQR
ncbi:hypothetical protein O0L34_g13501 [Tuta absoluta]|nr:hypothetical protein O0L34_g13501 [Tuta absoluta]